MADNQIPKEIDINDEFNVGYRLTVLYKCPAKAYLRSSPTKARTGMSVGG
jgi:hypothetical protein